MYRPFLDISIQTMIMVNLEKTVAYINVFLNLVDELPLPFSNSIFLELLVTFSVE